MNVFSKAAYADLKGISGSLVSRFGCCMLKYGDPFVQFLSGAK